MVKHIQILVLLLLFASINAEDNFIYRFKHITPAQGLPNSIVNCIYQAKNGFLWVGTNNGLARFDGYEFKVYLPDPFNNNSISHKSVENLLEDDQGRIWLLFPSKQIDCLDPKTGNISHFPSYSSSLASFDRKSTHVVMKDNKGNLWFGSNLGVCYFNVKEQTFHYLSHFGDIKIGKTYALAHDKNSHIFLGTEKGLFQFDLNTQNFRELRCKTPLDTAAISDLLVDNNNKLWVTTYNNGYLCIDLLSSQIILSESNAWGSINSVFESKCGDVYMLCKQPESQLLYFAKEVKYQKLPEKILIESSYMAEFFNFSEDASQNIWFSSSTGLYKFNPKKKNLIAIKNDPSIPSSIAENTTGPLFIDHTNVLWLGIYKVGMDKLDLNQKPFYFISKNMASQNESLPENTILSVLEDREGNLWLGTYSTGLLLRKKGQKGFTRINFGEKKINFEFATISSLFQDKNGDIWVGSYYSGLLKYNPRNSKIFIFSKYSDPACRATIIRKITADNEGNLWIASTSHGLVNYNFSDNKFNFYSELNDATYLDYGFYRTCYVDSRQRVWVGTQSGGILVFNKKGTLLNHIIHDSNNPKSLISNTVYDFFEDLFGAIWIGTASGLVRYKEAENQFLNFTTKEGLVNNTVYSIQQDTAKNLWLNTDFGLSLYDIKKDVFSNFYESDGLISNDFNSTASFKSSKNILYYGTSKGLLYFNPGEIKSNPYSAEPVITGLKIFNEDIIPGEKVQGRVITSEDIIYSKKIILTYKEYLFSIGFSTLNYSASENVNYQYRLEPFDKGWFLTNSNQRWVNYTNLKPGTYFFRVKATNSDGEWEPNGKEAGLIIEILPPFWKTWWFRTIFAFTLLGLAVLVYYSRMQQFRRNQKKLETLVANRTRMWEESNQALELQKQEIVQQKEKLEFNNKLLREQQDRILHQNIELDTHRHHLEQMVEDRTTELKEAREKAEESSRLKSAFLANMSHEIRTPMNAIVGFSNLLSTSEYTEEQKQEFINIIRKNGEGLLVIIDDILDLSKIQSKQLIIVPKPFELKSFLLDIYKSFQVSVSSKKLELTLIIDHLQDPTELCSDPVRLKQVFVNLINNAVKFTPEGSITFGIKSLENDFIEFFIKDTGYGIPPEWHDAIFERFIKVSTNPGENQTGAGLGLAISKSLIELLGGKIWFESEVDKGTCFYFTIPFKKQDQTTMIEKPKLSNANLDSILKNKTVLIVEDEEANFRVLQAFLKIKQIASVHVLNGMEAIAVIKENPKFDAVLMDIRMPVMDGVTAMHRIHEINPNIPIIAETAYATLEERTEYESTGFDYYLVKPISQQELYHSLYTVFTRNI